MPVGRDVWGGRSRETGLTLVETVLALSLLAIVAAAGAVSVTRYMSQRTLLGWSDVVVNDIRGAQQTGIARRAPVTVTFTARTSVTPAAYSVAVGGVTTRHQALPAELDVTAQTIQFTSLGIPTSGTAASVQLSDSGLGTSRILTIAPVTGRVTAQ